MARSAPERAISGLCPSKMACSARERVISAATRWHGSARACRDRERAISGLCLSKMARSARERAISLELAEIENERCRVYASPRWHAVLENERFRPLQDTQCASSLQRSRTSDFGSMPLQDGTQCSRTLAESGIDQKALVNTTTDIRMETPLQKKSLRRFGEIRGEIPTKT